METGRPFQHELIDLARKPPEFLELHASVKPGETAKVPLLELDGRVIVESIDVAKAVASGTPLYPPGDAACIDDFVSHWCAVERAYYAVLSASSEHAVRTATAAFVESLSGVENRLWERRMASDRCCDGGAFLCGEAFTLAECVAAPWVERMSAMLPLWRNIDFAALCEGHGLTKVAAWSDAVLERPSVQTTSAGTEETARAARRYYVEYVSPGAAGVL